MTQQAYTYQSPYSPNERLKFLLYLPKEYGTDPAKYWPLLLFLHGRGECGDDLEMLKAHGIPKIVEERDDFPFVVVSPQCPLGTDWTPYNATLIGLLDKIGDDYKINEDRIYLTGLSMGGRGAWLLALEYNELFAAVAPICGRIPQTATMLRSEFLEQIHLLKHTPFWVFHGVKDQIVPISNSEKLVAALRTYGGNVRYTVYPDADHDSWTETYSNPELYEWMLSNTFKP